MLRWLRVKNKKKNNFIMEMFSSQNVSLESRFLRTELLHTVSYFCNPGLYRAPFPLEWAPGVREEGVREEGAREEGVRSIPSL